jgi:hypothetical protein
MPDATVHFTGMIRSQAIGVRVSNIISLSAQLDHELSLLLVRLLGANVQVAHAMFEAVKSARIKNAVLTAAVNVELREDPQKLLLFRAVLKAADIAQEDRNRIAHWIAGESPDLPGDLLLADPDFLRSQTLKQEILSEKYVQTSLAQALQKYTPVNNEQFDQQIEEEMDEFKRAWDVDKDHVYVYTPTDLVTATERLLEALQAQLFFRYVLRPLNRLLDPGNPPDPEVTDFQTSDGALRRLNSLGLFQTAFARVSGSKDPNSKP